VEVEINKENQSILGCVIAALLAVLTWFLGGIISAGTGRGRRR
jgi:hypothetical protein